MLWNINWIKPNLTCIILLFNNLTYLQHATKRTTNESKYFAHKCINNNNQISDSKIDIENILFAPQLLHLELLNIELKSQSFKTAILSICQTICNQNYIHYLHYFIIIYLFKLVI